MIAHEVQRHTNGGTAEIIAAILRAVSEGHDLALDSVVLVKANKIPKTSSGKIQRHACRNGYLDGSLAEVKRWHVSDGPPQVAAPPADEPASAGAATDHTAKGAGQSHPVVEAVCTARSPGEGLW